MWNKLKNKLIIKLLKNTHLNAHTCYAFVAKINHDELRTYMRGYTQDPRTDKEKFDFIFGKER